MGLISCPKCGEMISEKAAACPHCKSGSSKDDMIICEDCKNEYDISMYACPNCGCPNSTVKQKGRKHKGAIILTIVIAVVTVSILGICASLKAKENEYRSYIETVSSTMLDGGTRAVSAGNLILSVWYNAIYEKQDSITDKYTMNDGVFVEDFDYALSNLFADEDFGSSISEIVTDRSEVVDLMKCLKDPPKKNEKIYSLIKVCYDNYMKLTRIVIDPIGSYKSVSEEFNACVNSTKEAFEEMALYLD